MRTKRTLRRTLFTLSFIVVIAVVAIIAFISPLTKYLVEKYDEKYTGRQIEMDWAYVNPFTGYIYFNDLKIYEQNSDSVFFSVHGITVDVSLFKMLNKTYEIKSVMLDKPWVKIVQDKKLFNFSDLIEKFSSKDTLNIDTIKKEPVHFNVLDIRLKNGEFHYQETEIPVNYFIKDLEVSSEGMRWDVDTVAVKFSFTAGIGSGDMQGEFTINMDNMDYKLHAAANKYDLKIIEQYMKDFTNYGSFRASMDADIKATGNFKDNESIDANGLLAINEFHFGKTPHDDYASFRKLMLDITRLNPKAKAYVFNSVILSHPYLKYERYDSLDNLQYMFGVKGSNVAEAKAETSFNLIFEIADYVKVLAKNFLQSDYKINKLAIDSANIQFNDYSLREKFAVAINPMSISADSVDKRGKNDRVKVLMTAEFEPYGSMNTTLSINAKDNEDFDLDYGVHRVPAAMFNPYFITYTSYPMDRGRLEINGKWHVVNGEIDGQNHIMLIDPRLAKRIKNKDVKWLPLPLIMAFVRERGNVIDYQIPITGNLKDPKFHLGDVIWDLITNIFVKPVTTPYRIEVKSTENELEKSLALKWPMNKAYLQRSQEKFVDKIAGFLKDNPEAIISVYPISYGEKEKENMLFYEAKKKYFLVTCNKKPADYTEDDSVTVEKMSIKDPAFIKYLDKHIKNTLVFTVQQKCALFIGMDVVNRRYNRLMKERQEVFMQFFKENGTQKQVKLHPVDSRTPFNGYSFFKIEYKGDVPETVEKAYNKLEELDDEKPRKEYKKFRWRRKIPLLNQDKD